VGAERKAGELVGSPAHLQSCNGSELLYEFNAPFVVDSSKFVQAFGDIATSHHEAVRQTLEWYHLRCAGYLGHPFKNSGFSAE
jgi:hypothetical protein